MDLLTAARWALVSGLVLCLWPDSDAHAQLSPGPLQQSHQTLEGLSRCTQCHALGKGIEHERCLQCHEPLRLRIEGGRGLHSRPGYEDCTECHTDHQGREYQMIRWPGEQKDFPHEEAGYELRLAHAKVECRGCHQAKLIANQEPLLAHSKDLDRTFLGLETSCRSCHEDKHEKTVGDDCTRCHDESVWKPAPKFDHARTEYPLDGKHIDIPCQKCHPTTPRFPRLAFGQCTDCHKDPHKGDLGPDCVKCHTTSSWAQVTSGDFNHDKTKFRLVGAHKKVTCARCHVSGQSIANRLSCDQCHQDVHNGSFLLASTGRTDCARCHSSDRFVPSTYGFANHAESRYPLTGAHLAVPCADCHGTTGLATSTIANTATDRSAERVAGGNAIYRWTSLDCASCHSDAHEASFRRVVQSPEPCATCHRTDAWTTTVFAHETTNYRLEGAHTGASCVACHSSLVRQTVASWETTSVVPMLAPLAATTASETPAVEMETWNGFRANLGSERAAVRADAARERDDRAWKSREAARGRRAIGPDRTVGRGAAVPASLRLDDAPHACTGCHRDPHGDQFNYLSAELPRTEGVDPGSVLCSRCHGTTRWSAEKFDHERDSRYSLKGAHEKVTCSECHRREADGRQRFRPLGTECRDCHAITPRIEP